MSKHEAIAVSVYLGSMFVAIAVIALSNAWRDVRVTQAEAAACVCEEKP